MERLQLDDVRVLDGGLATLLEAKGCVLDDPLWSGTVLVSDPERVLEAHRDYSRAGAQILTSASYQLTFQGLARRGVHREEARRLFHRSVQLCREADPKCLVAASIGPYGAFLGGGEEYTGEYGSISDEELRAFHEDRIVALWEAKPDFLLFETTPRMNEARVYLSILEQYPDMRAVISFQCRPGCLLASREPLEQLEHPQLLGISVNCCPPAVAVEIAEHFQLRMAYPNSGEVYQAATNQWQKQDIDMLILDAIPLLKASGVKIIGGCCRVGPEIIRQIAKQC